MQSWSLNNSSLGSFADGDSNSTEEDEYIFDRDDVRAIFITLYTIVFCCCFFGKYDSSFICCFMLFSTGQNLLTPCPESASELHRPSDFRLSEKLVTTFADGESHMVSVTDPYGGILGFPDRSSYFFFQVAPQLYSPG
jgi:hypothetical protein